MTSKPARVSISATLSMLLDLTRVVLSLTVATGHWTQGFFQDSWPDLTRFAVMAVGAFFVLSGFTIRMLYPARDDFSFGHYVAERWSRILSVTLPALLLTVMLDVLSWRANPAYYLGNWPELLDHPVRRLLVNLLGFAQVWGHDIAPLSNSPFWSISYELGFYLVYGLWLSGRRVLAVAALLLLGPQIALLLPLWLLGVVVYDVGCTSSNTRFTVRRAMAVGILAVGALIGIRAVAVLGERARVALVAFGFELHRVSLTLIATALLFFAIFIVATPILNRIVLHPPARARAIVRWFGNLTFPIYLFHFPMFVFLGALQLYDRNSVLQRVAAFLLVLAIIAAIAPATDYFKIRLRTTLSWTFTKSRAYCAAVALAVLE